MKAKYIYYIKENFIDLNESYTLMLLLSILFMSRTQWNLYASSWRLELTK
jgi:hypothetical protein